MFKKFLLNEYGFNEPIFLNDLTLVGMSDNAIRQSVKRLVSNGFLERFSNGVYYIPKPNGLLDKTYIDPFLVLERKYIRNKLETYGYVSGLYFANLLGLTSQMPAIIDVVTNREATNGRDSQLGSLMVRIKKPSVMINESNADMLQFLDCVNQVEKYSELSYQDTVDIMKSYIQKKNFTKQLLSSVSGSMTGTTAKKLIAWGLVYEFK